MAGAEQKIINVKIKGVNDLLKLKAELNKLKKEQQKVKKVNKETEKDWIDKERAIAKATKKYRENRKELANLNKEQKKSSKATASFGKNLLKTAAVVTTVIATFRLLGRAMKSAFQVFTDFEFSMAKVKAISGATNSEFIKLEQSAKELGRTTFFTAKEVAELQVNFSKLGFTAEQILNLQEATLDLAMATGSDLARSAMVAGSAVRGFGLDADEATRVVDVMAVAFTSSALDIEKWQTSMTKVSAIAASMGVDIEGTAAVMGALSDTGIEASIAGTSLRNIFLKMANPTSTLAKRIGFVVQSTEDMVRALKILKQGQIGQLEMQTLVDKRQVIAMQSMIANVHSIEDLIVKLNDAEGAGAEMASIMEDSTKGAFKRFRSAIEGISIVISEKMAPAVNYVTNLLTRFVGAISDATETKVSDQFTKDARVMNAMAEAMQNTNNSLDTRKELLRRFNRRYSEYLDFQLDDVTNTDALALAQEKLNDTFEQRIKLQIASEDLTAFYRRGSEITSLLADLEVQIDDMERRAGMSPGEVIKERLAKNKEDILEELRKKGIEVGAEGEKASVEGFMKIMGATLKRLSGNVRTVVGAMFEDFTANQALAHLLETQKELQAEELTRPEELKKLQQAYTKADGDLNKFLASLKKRGSGKKKNCKYGIDPATGECLPEPETVRNFAQEIAIYEADRRKQMELGFLMEQDFEQQLLDKKADLLKAEFKQIEEGDQRKEGAYIKYLKALERADKNRYNNQLKNIEKNYRKEKRLLDEQAREGTGRTLQHVAKELELEKKMLQEKLDATKKYSKEWEKIQRQMEDVSEEIADNKKDQEVEANEFALELTKLMADTSLQILSNGLKQEKAEREKVLNDTYNWELQALDRQLENKEISQATYDGQRLIAETEFQAEEEKLQKEFAKREKNMKKAQAVINGALAITAALVNPVTAPFTIPLIIGTTAAQIALIESQAFAKGGMIEEFAQGGMVQGKSHAQGGEKFAVGGRVVELEGGEAVINKRSTAMFKSQLSAMNAAGGGVKFADGGLLNSNSFNSVKFNAAQFNQPSGSNKVVVVESDITNSQSKVKAIQSNASF